MRSYMTWAANMVPGDPHISSHVGFSMFALIAVISFRS